MTTAPCPFCDGTGFVHRTRVSRVTGLETAWAKPCVCRRFNPGSRVERKRESSKANSKARSDRNPS